MVLESFFFLSSNVCACHVLQIAKPLLPVTLICSLYIHTICHACIQSMKVFFFLMLLRIKSYLFIIKCSRKISELEGWRNRFVSPATWIWRHWCVREEQITQQWKRQAIIEALYFWSKGRSHPQKPSPPPSPTKKKRALATRVKTRLNPDSLIQQQKN